MVQVLQCVKSLPSMRIDFGRMNATMSSIDWYQLVDNASEYISGVTSSKSFDVMRPVTDIQVEGADLKIIGDKGETGDVYPEAVSVTTEAIESFFSLLIKFEVWEG